MRIGTRGSALALWQAHTVARLIADSGGPRCEIVVIRTSGDERAAPPDAPPVARTGGAEAATAAPEANVKRMFVKEIEEALIEGHVELAVHSAKDLPADLPDGLAIGAAIARGDPRDVLLRAGASGAHDLRTLKAAVGEAPRIGTSSVRRAAQLRALFPRATFSPIRGNVDTRLRKLDAGDCDLLVLAAAGLDRLGLGARVTAHLPPEVCVPAPGQGIVAIEVSRGAPAEVAAWLARIDDADAATALIAERAVMLALGGGCRVPLGVLATLDGPSLSISAVVASLDGGTVARATVRGYRGGPAAAGDALAAKLLARGAAAVLAAARADA